MDLLLYDTTLAEAKDKKEELIKAFAELLDVDPKDVDLVFKEDEHGRVVASFVLDNPSEENKELCGTQQLPARLRAKIVKENVLPKQELAPAVISIKEVDPALLAKEEEELVTELCRSHALPIHDFELNGISNSDKASYVLFTKPKNVASTNAVEVLDDLLKVNDGFEFVTVEDATMFNFPFYGVSKEDADKLKDKLEFIVAKLLSVPQEEVDSIIGLDETNSYASVDFFITNPNVPTREVCESGEMPPKIRLKLEEDKEIAKLLPKRTKSPLLLSGVTLDDVKNNPKAVLEAVAKALGIPVSEVDLDTLVETPNGILVEVGHPDDVVLSPDFAEKVKAELLKEPDFENVDVTQPAVLDLKLYHVTPEEAKAKEDELKKLLGALLNVDPDSIDVVFEKDGDDTIAKFVIKDPTEEVKKLCDSKSLPADLRAKLEEEKVLPHQAILPAAVCLKDIDTETVMNNMPLLEESVSNALKVPLNDIECTDVLESEKCGKEDELDKGIFVKFNKPVAIPSDDIYDKLDYQFKDVEPFEKAKVEDAATFTFPFYGVSEEDANSLKEKLEEIVGGILDIPANQVESQIKASETGHAVIDFFIANPKEETKAACESGEMPPKIRMVIESDDELAKVLPNMTTSPLLLNGVSLEDVKANPDAVKKAIADALGVDPSEISLEDIHETEQGLVIEFNHPADKKLPPNFAELTTAGLQKTPAFASAVVTEPAVLDFKLYDTNEEAANGAKEDLKKALAELLEVNPDDLVIVFKPFEHHIPTKFIVVNPSEENLALCQGKDLPTRLRGKIHKENILPNQQLAPTVVSLKNVDPELVKANGEELEEELARSHATPISDIGLGQIVATDKATYVNYVKPQILTSTAAVAILDDLLEQNDGFEKVKVEDGTTFNYPFYGVEKKVADGLKDKLEEIVANILSTPKEEVDSIVNEPAGDDKFANIDFFVTNPSTENRNLCESGTMPPKIREALSEDKDLANLIADRTTTPVRLNGITMEDVQNNPKAVIDAIAKALGIPPSEVDLEKVVPTDKGVMVEVSHPDDVVIPADFAEKVKAALSQEPGFENVDVEEPAVLTLKLYDTSLADATAKKDDLIKALAELLDVDPKSIELTLTEDENGNVDATFMVTDPTEDVKKTLETKKLTDDLRQKLDDEKILPHQKLVAGAICLTDCDVATAQSNAPLLEEAVCSALGVLPNDVECLSFAETDKGTYMKFNKPEVCKTKENIDQVEKNLKELPPLESVEPRDAAVFDFQFYNTPIENVKPMKEALEKIVAAIFVTPVQNVDAIPLTNKDGSYVDFFIANPTVQMVEDCESGVMPPKVRKVLESDDKFADILPPLTVTPVLLNGVSLEDIENNPALLKKALASALGVPVSQIDLDDIFVTDKGIVVAVKHPADAAVPEDFTDKLSAQLKKLPMFKDVEVSKPGVMDFVLYNTDVDEADKLKDDLKKMLANLLNVDPDKLAVSLIPKGDHTVVKFVLLDPTEENLEMLKDVALSQQLRDQLVADKLTTDQQLAPAVFALKKVKPELVKDNIKELHDELVRSHEVPPSDIPISEVYVVASDVASYVNFMKPEILSSAVAVEIVDDLWKQNDGFENLIVQDATKFNFPFYGVPKDLAEPMKDKLENIVSEILGIPKRNVDCIIGEKFGSADIDFFVTNPKAKQREMCGSGDMPSKIMALLRKEKDPNFLRILPKQKVAPLILTGIAEEDVENNPEALLEALASALGIPVSQLALDQIVATKDGVLVEVSLPEDVELPKDLTQKVTLALHDDPVYANVEALQPAVVGLTLYDTDVEAAKAKEDELKKLLAQILGVDPSDIEIYIDKDGGNVLCKLVIANPSEDDKLKCDAVVLLPELRAKIADAELLPHQELDPVVVCLKDIAPELVLKNPDAIKAALVQAIGVDPNDVVDVDIVATDKLAAYVKFTKPIVIDPKDILAALPIALSEQADLDNVAIENATMFVFPFDGVSPEKAEELKSRLAAIVAKLLIVPVDTVDVTIDEIDGDALCSFFITSPNGEVKRKCESGEMPSRLKSALKADDEISQILPAEAKDAILLSNVNIDDVKNNPDLILKLLAEALGVPPSKLTLGDIILTPEGDVLIEFEHLDNIEIPKDFADNVTAQLQAVPIFKDAVATHPATLDFMLYETSLETAEANKKALVKLLADLLKVDPENISLTCEDDGKGNVKCKFMIKNPSEATKEFCLGKGLPNKLRKKVAKDLFLPNQEMSPAVLCLKNVDFGLVNNSIPDIENVMAEAYEVPHSDVQCQKLQEADDYSIFMNYSKPAVVPIAASMKDISDNLKAQPGFGDAEILDAATFDFSLYGKSKAEVDPATEKLRETAAKVIGVSKDEIGLIITEDEDGNATVQFFVLNPDAEIKEKCNSGEYQPKIRKALQVDDATVGLIPEKKKGNLILNGITVDLVNKNPDLVVKLLAMALGVPLDEIEINGITETPEGIIIDFALPESAEMKPELTAKLATSLQNQPGFEDVKVASVATVDLDMFNVPEENVEKIQDRLIAELAKILGVDPSQIKVMIIPNGNHIGVKLMVVDPNLDLQLKIGTGEPEKELKSWVTMDAIAKEILPNQKLEPGALHLDGVTLDDIKYNLPIVQAELAKAMGVPTNSIEITDVKESPSGKGVMLFYLHPKGMELSDEQNKDLILKLRVYPVFAKIDVVYVSIFGFNIYNCPMEVAEKIKHRLADTLGIILDTQPDGIFVLLKEDGDHAALRFVIMNRSEPIDSLYILQQMRLAIANDPEIKAILPTQAIKYTMPLPSADTRLLSRYSNEILEALANVFECDPAEIKDFGIKPADPGSMLAFTIPMSDHMPSAAKIQEHLLSEFRKIPKVFALLARSQDIMATTLPLSNCKVEDLEPHVDEFRAAMAEALGISIDDILDVQFTQHGDNVDVKFITKRKPEISEALKELNIAPFLGKQPNIGELLGFAPKRGTISTALQLPKAKADKLEPLKDNLKVVLAKALGIDPRDIIHVGLEENANGVQVNFKLYHSKEAIEAMQRGLNINPYLKEDADLADALGLKPANKRKPEGKPAGKVASGRSFTTQLPLANVTAEELEPLREALIEAMANALGIDPSEIRDLEFIKNGDGVLATFSIDYTEQAVKNLQNPEFNVMPYLQANEDLAKLLGVPYIPSYGGVLPEDDGENTRTMKMNLELTNTDKATLDPLKEDLRSAMAIALGIPIDQVPEIELTETENGVVVTFVINATPETLAKLNSPEFNMNAVLAANDNLANALNLPQMGGEIPDEGNESYPIMNLQLTFEHVDPADVDLDELQKSLAAVLGIDPNDIQKFEIIPMSDDKLQIVCTMVQSPSVVDVLNKPDFNIYVALAAQPIAEALNLAKPKISVSEGSYIFAFPSVSPDDLIPFEQEIIGGFSALIGTKDIHVAEFKQDMNGTSVMFEVSGMDNDLKTMLAKKSFHEGLFRAYWLTPGVSQLLIDIGVLGETGVALVGTTPKQAKKLTKSLVFTVANTLGIEPSQIETEVKAYGDHGEHVVIRFVFLNTIRVQKALEDSDIPKRVQTLLKADEGFKNIPDQGIDTSYVCLAGVLKSEIEENYRALVDLIADALGVPSSLVSIADITEISEGVIATITHPTLLPLTDKVLERLTGLLREFEPIQNEQSDIIEARPHVHYQFMFSGVQGTDLSPLEDELIAAFAETIDLPPEEIIVENIDNVVEEDVGSVITFGIEASAISPDEIFMLSQPENFNPQLGMNLEKQPGIMELLKKLGLDGDGELEIAITFDGVNVMKLKAYFETLKDVFADLAGVKSEQVRIVDENGEDIDDEEDSDEVPMSMFSLAADDDGAEEKNFLNFKVESTESSQQALSNPDQFDKNYKDALSMIPDLSDVLGIHTDTRIESSLELPNCTPEDLEPFKGRILVLIAQVATVDPKDVQIVAMTLDGTTTILLFSVKETPFSAIQIKELDFSANVFELLAKEPGLNKLLGLVWEEPDVFTVGASGKGGVAAMAKALDAGDASYAVVNMKVCQEKKPDETRIVPVCVKFTGKTASKQKKQRLEDLHGNLDNLYPELEGMYDASDPKAITSAKIIKALTPDVFNKGEVDASKVKPKKKKAAKRKSVRKKKGGKPKKKGEISERVAEILKLLNSDTGWVNWALFKVNSDKLTLAKKDSFGSGTIFAMKEYLNDKEVYFGLLRLSFGARPYRRSWVVMFHWTGPKVGMVKRGKLNAKKGDMSELLRPYHVQISINTKEDVTVENIINRVRDIVVVDGMDEDGDGKTDDEEIINAFRKALEEEEEMNANVEQVLKVDKGEDGLTPAEVIERLRDGKNTTNFAVFHPIPEKRKFSRAVSRGASLSGMGNTSTMARQGSSSRYTGDRTKSGFRQKSSRKFNFVGKIKE